MSDEMPEWMYGVYSRPRLASYLSYSHGDSVRAANLYNWNVMASSAFHGPLHALELALRNSMHDRLSDFFARSDWWVPAPLNDVGRGQVDKAGRKCLRRLPHVTPDDLVTELNFGFWVSLLSGGYDRALWRTALHRAFPGYRGPRRHLRNDLDYLRVFRNRIMHYEPIHHRHLEADHASIYRVLSHISPAAASGIKPMDRVPEVLLVKERMCRGDVPPSF